MKRIIVIGCAGQIGSELVLALRKIYGTSNVVATDIAPEKITGELSEGPSEALDIRDAKKLDELVKKYKADTIYNLAALLSATAEKNPQLAWEIGLAGHYGVLEVARENKCCVFFPSSIGSFGPTTPKQNTPQDTIQRPNTMYGVTKVSAELLGDYYFKRFGVDSRGVRFPGIISNVTLPGGGTTDYAVEIYYEAVKTGKYVCPLKQGTYMDMMYMPDAIKAAIDIMEADLNKLIHHNGFNVTAMSLEPDMLYKIIKKYIPSFEMTYDIEPVKQGIADSWPNSIDDSCARNEWGWKPNWHLENMTEDMLKTIAKKYNKDIKL